MKYADSEYVEVKQGRSKFYLTKLQAGALAEISYASIRGKDSEEGAVQRILNTRRINSIADFAEKVGHFPSSIVLNWVNKTHPIKVNGASLSIPIAPRSAQLIDGQHRVEGLREAIDRDRSIAKIEIPVAIYTSLTTQQCADIFLSINTEQKPVPRTLVFDLYGVADPEIVDPAAARARDIAIALNVDDDSPYRGTIKFPGSPRSRGGIALSTFVTALKPLVEEKGDFEQRTIVELETQQKIIKNFFGALESFYGERWLEPTNVFMYGSGFIGGIDFFRTKMLTYCQDRLSFKLETMKAAFDWSPSDLILQEEVKGKSGKEAALVVVDRLTALFRPARAKGQKFEV